MFFKRKKPSPQLPNDPDSGPVSELPSADGESLDATPGSVSTLFLTGDQGRDRDRVEVLLGAIAQVNDSLELEPLLIDIVDRSIDVTGAERGILLMVGKGGQLEARVARGRGGVDVPGFGASKVPGSPETDLRFSTSIANRVLESGEALRATVSSDSEALELGRSVFDLKLRAAMCVPLTSDRDGGKGPPQGVLYVDSRAATRQFTQSDLSFFAALAQHISISLLNARLHLDSIEKLRLEQSLELASAIQRDLMPNLAETELGFELGGFFRPAERAGGDFYDAGSQGRKGSERLAVVIGDVSGHGIGPALITAAAQAGLRSYLRVVPGVDQAITLLNQDLSDRMDDGRFVTLLLAMIEPDGTFELVNAGHAAPLIWRAESGEVLEPEGGEPALGMIEDHDYEVTSKGQLAPGDVMVVYSDGLSEARDPENHDRMLGTDGLAEALAHAAAAGLDAKGITARLVEAALGLAKEWREDDMTLLVVRRPPA